MEMVPMDMGQIDIVRLKAVDQFAARLWIVPPATPIARTDEPWVTENGPASVFHEQASVADYRKSHVTSFSRNLLVNASRADPSRLLPPALADGVPTHLFQQIDRARRDKIVFNETPHSGGQACRASRARHRQHTFPAGDTTIADLVDDLTVSSATRLADYRRSRSAVYRATRRPRPSLVTLRTFNTKHYLYKLKRTMQLHPPVEPDKCQASGNIEHNVKGGGKSSWDPGLVKLS